MKKLKTIISLFICGAILLSARASAPTASLQRAHFAKSGIYPEVLNIFQPNFFMDGSIQNDENIKTKWLDEMSKRYGTKINISSGPDGIGNGMVWMDIYCGNRTYPGLVFTSGIEILQKAVESNTAVPLEDYLKNNPIWNSLPEEIKSIFEIDGHIYAIPTGVENCFESRVFYKDMLEQTGINVIDLKSLKEFAVAYTKSTGNYAISSCGLSKLTDILNAFGLYSNGESNPLSYDPTEDCIADFLTKDAAVDALEYLRELYTAGALYIGQDFFDHKVVSFYDSNRQFYNINEYSHVISLNQNYPRIPLSYVNGFFMTKDTPQPEESLNLFLNMVFGSEQNFLDCWLGLSDGYILNNDGTITMKMVKISDDFYIDPPTPDLAGNLSDVFPYSDAKILYSIDDKISLDPKTLEGRINQDYVLYKDALQKRIIVEVPPAYTVFNSPAFLKNEREINNLCEICIKDAVTATDRTVQQAIDEYKAAMLNMGGNQMLDEINAAIGKKTAYYYG